MPFAQVVIGPPGSGKTTYCDGVQQLLTAVGRPCSVVNLDPAQVHSPYQTSVDICELITVSDVMDELKLGPNGALVYCMNFLQQNLDWLKERLLAKKDEYMLIDFPGQVELYTHHDSLKEILKALQSWDIRLVSVHLVDAHHCSDAAKFISVALLSLSATINLNLPHVNVLSKVDLLQQYGKLDFDLESYADLDGLDMLLEHLDEDDYGSKHRKLNEAIVGLLEDYNMVSFAVLSILDRESTQQVVQTVDKAMGYVYIPPRKAATRPQPVDTPQEVRAAETMGDVMQMLSDESKDETASGSSSRPWRTKAQEDQALGSGSFKPKPFEEATGKRIRRVLLEDVDDVEYETT